MFNEQDIFLINEGLVDSRAKETAGHPLITHPQLKLEMVYCVFCLKPKGWVSQDSFKYIRAQNIIVVCDNCHESNGELPLQRAHIQDTPIRK